MPRHGFSENPELSKPGEFGTLHRYRVEYGEPDGYHGAYYTWAYSAEHAADKFHDSNEESFQLEGVRRATHRDGLSR